MTIPSERPHIVDSRERHSHQGEASPLTRFFGGPPLSVLFRLALLSIIIGVILEVLGLDPLHLMESLRTLVLRIWDMGFDAVRWMWRYLVLGAAVVVPVWLLLRLTHAAKGR
jgi:hypothetical protein